eukprot:SM000076S21803  [mRNA]  locus=s76:327320:327918:+ [translate_table: standard]
MALPPCHADAVAAGAASASAATRTVHLMLDDGGVAWRSLLRAREQQAAQLRLWEEEFHHGIVANLERIDALDPPDSPESPETPAACRKRKPSKRSPNACSSSKRAKASVCSPPLSATSSSGTCSAPESGASSNCWQACLEPAI